MSEEGFLKLSRRVFDHELWREPRVFSRAEAWLDFIASAAYRDRKTLIRGVLIPLKRGELVASVRFLEKRWNWSNSKVCLFLDLLCAESMIRRETRQGVTVISLCNFEEYNALSDGKATPERQESDGKAAGERQRGDEIEEGKEYVPTPSAGARELPKTIEDVRLAASRFQPTSTVREKPDEGFVEWWFDEQEKRGWVDPQTGLPWRDWQAAFRSAWRATSHKTAERNAKTYGPNQRPDQKRSGTASGAAPLRNRP